MTLHPSPAAADAAVVEVVEVWDQQLRALDSGCTRESAEPETGEAVDIPDEESTPAHPDFGVDTLALVVVGLMRNPIEWVGVMKIGMDWVVDILLDS